MLWSAIVVDPDVSVIVPTPRCEKLVVRAVASALSQRDTRLEVLVLDDTEEGSAREAIASISDPRVVYIKRETPSRGRPALVRNEGIPRANGRFLHFLDDHDALHDAALASLRAPLEAQPALGTAFAVVDPFRDDAEVLSPARTHYSQPASSART